MWGTCISRVRGCPLASWETERRKDNILTQVEDWRPARLAAWRRRPRGSVFRIHSSKVPVSLCFCQGAATLHCQLFSSPEMQVSLQGIRCIELASVISHEGLEEGMGVCNIFKPLPPTSPPHPIHAIHQPAPPGESVLPDPPPERGKQLAEVSTAIRELRDRAEPSQAPRGSGELDKVKEGAEEGCEIERNLRKPHAAPAGRKRLQEGQAGPVMTAVCAGLSESNRALG